MERSATMVDSIKSSINMYLTIKANLRGIEKKTSETTKWTQN